MPAGFTTLGIEGIEHLLVALAMEEKNFAIDDDRTAEPLPHLAPPEALRSILGESAGDHVGDRTIAIRPEKLRPIRCADRRRGKPQQYPEACRGELEGKLHP